MKPMNSVKIVEEFWAAVWKARNPERQSPKTWRKQVPPLQLTTPRAKKERSAP